MEKARLFSVRHTHVIILQRWWRECSAFRLVETMKYAQIPPQIMKVYKQYRFKQKEDLDFKHQHMKVKAHYRHEIKQARGAFMTGTQAGLWVLRCTGCEAWCDGGRHLQASVRTAQRAVRTCTPSRCPRTSPTPRSAPPSSRACLLSAAASLTGRRSS